MIQSILEQTLLFFPFAMGVYLSFAILKIPDLTVDGTFVVGAAVFAKGGEVGFSPLIAVMMAIITGGLIGAVVACFQQKERINPLIVGVLAFCMLQSVALLVMQRPNIPLHGFSFPGSFFKQLLLVNIFIIVLGHFFLKSSFVLRLRAFGSGADLLKRMKMGSERYRIAGLALGNALVAFSGCLSAQAQGFADVNMGRGQILIAISVVLIGLAIQQKLFPLFRGIKEIMCCFFGTAIYFSVVNFLLEVGVDPLLLKLMMGGTLLGLLFLLGKKREAVSCAY